ncbi:MAG: hypothetical protein FWF82_06630 [Oscillospiraceae bacterium]|nr:hypothetical protein [Oscillospiraceae bacterium]
MANILKLHNPVMINGKEVSEITHDSNEIDGVLFATAEYKRKMSAGVRNSASVVTPAMEFDFGLHLYIGFAAIIAVNPEYDFSDVERIKGRDIIDVTQIGRNFMLKSEADSTQNDSDEPTATTPESTTPPPPPSNEDE